MSSKVNRPSSRQSTRSEKNEKIQEQSSPMKDSSSSINGDQTKEKSNRKMKSISEDPNLRWLAWQKDERGAIRTPEALENELVDPPSEGVDSKILDRVQGSLMGMALGDALGASVEFRPHDYFKTNRVKGMQEGGTWGLKKGQWTDDTSMALCLANSLIDCDDFIPYDQLVKYQWWYRDGYMSSTGECFDIGAGTAQALNEFQRRQKLFEEHQHYSIETRNRYFDETIMKQFDVYCSETGVAGNGGLMRLAPIPLFFFRNIFLAIEFSGRSAEITHGDRLAVDAARYYGALIASVLRGIDKKEILHNGFYQKHRKWFWNEELDPKILQIANGSFRKPNGYDGGIRGKGFVVNALEAALWAFWSTTNFRDGALAAVNLGDDTDTTAAIYGQLAGAYYGYKGLPVDWLDDLYGKKYLETLSKWIVYKGKCWEERDREEFEKYLLKKHCG